MEIYLLSNQKKMHALYKKSILSQRKWWQMKPSPLKAHPGSLGRAYVQHGPVINCRRVLWMTKCDRRPRQIPAQTLSVAQHSIVGLFQSAISWKAAIDISPTHLVTLLITIVVQAKWGAMCWYQQTEPREGLGCLKEKVGGVPCCAIPLVVCQNCISLAARVHKHTQQNTRRCTLQNSSVRVIAN